MISTVIEPFRFTVPAKTSSELPLLTGMDSPVMAASSKVVVPFRIFPSDGTRSPGFTRIWSPMLSSETCTRCSPPSVKSRASSGCSSISDDISLLLLFIVYVSSAPLTAKMKIRMAPSVQ
ncbi:Uncharacterised protein [Mycobacteroides abscessus subsp. abscessus]|nr:Uncharacterised protein [Mycobacteroides abscessus subsp. abscessus]